MNNIDGERRGSRSRALTRSLSYSEAIGNRSGRSSIEIPSIVNTEVYTNEDIKKQYRISQTYVEGKEITFTNYEPNTQKELQLEEYSSQYTTDDEKTDDGLVMTIDIDVESPKSSDKRNISDASTQPLVYSNVSSNDYDTIETINSLNTGDPMTQNQGYAHSYTRRRRGKKCR